jgi:phage tail tube protein FII
VAPLPVLPKPGQHQGQLEQEHMEPLRGRLRDGDEGTWKEKEEGKQEDTDHLAWYRRRHILALEGNEMSGWF